MIGPAWARQTPLVQSGVDSPGSHGPGQSGMGTPFSGIWVDTQNVSIAGDTEDTEAEKGTDVEDQLLLRQVKGKDDIYVP